MTKKGTILLFSLAVGGMIFLAFVLTSKVCSDDCASRGRLNIAKIQLHQFAIALKHYKLICGRYPNEAEGLEMALAEPITCDKKADSGVAKELQDPWRRNWIYKSSENQFNVYSLGADGKRGGVGKNIDIAISNKEGQQTIIK